MTSRDVLLRFLSVLLLIGLNAFFVTAEFSIVSVRRTRISQLVAAGDVPAQTVQSLQHSIDRLLSTTQIGITLSSLALGWIGESTMAVLVGKVINSLPLPQEITMAVCVADTGYARIAHSISIPVAFFSIAYLQIVLGELCPKSVALLYSEQLARFFAPPSLAIARLFHPFIWILNQSTHCLLRLLRIEYSGARYNLLTPEELQLIITTEKESTGLEAEERELLNNVFDFGDVLTEEVMTPRTSIKAINHTANFSTLLHEVASTGHSLYPIIGDSLDDIHGIIDFKDLALPLARGELQPQTLIQSFVKSVQLVPESTRICELLPLMQREQLKMVIVVDEFGGTAGLVTLQDLIVEIIGDVQELDSTTVGAPGHGPLQRVDENTFLVQAGMNLEEVNEILALNLPLTEEYQTLGGFLLYQWQKIPAPGETLHHGQIDFTVISVAGPKLEQIRIHRPNIGQNQKTENQLKH